jgi:ADP-ribose pyrophosphatase YjhB (NUDIX family)
MSHSNTAHEVLAVVFQVRQPKTATGAEKPQLSVLLWQRARDPQRHTWSLPGGGLRQDEDMTTSVRRQLAEKVDLRELAHLEQLAVFSDPARMPATRTIASTFLGLVPSPATPELPPDTCWHPVTALPITAFDHGPMIAHARARLVAKMSYTNIGFALAPTEFAVSTLRDIYGATLGYQVDATNLQRVLTRRRVITQTGTIAWRTGGRPAALYRFTDSRLRVTDEFAALRPPG